MNPQATGSHWSDDQLIARLYGIGETDARADAHLTDCESCSTRWEDVQVRRANVAVPPSVPAPLLATQRRRILERLTPAPLWHWRRVWVPALAAAALAVAGFVFYPSRETAAPPSAPLAVDQMDPSWYDDSYSGQPVEPRAAGPLRELFEEEATE